MDVSYTRGTGRAFEWCSDGACVSRFAAPCSIGAGGRAVSLRLHLGAGASAPLPTARRFDQGVAAIHDIFVATTRQKAADPKAVFDRRRSQDSAFSRIAVSVPEARKVGSVERPKGSRPDPACYFTARSITAYDGLATFSDHVRDAAEGDGGRALVFVHGYNTPFDAAVYRATQIVHDAGYDGAPILFTWPSGGRAVDYVFYDRDSANAARDALEQLLRSLAKSGVRRIDIVAHSMGTWRPWRRSAASP